MRKKLIGSIALLALIVLNFPSCAPQENDTLSSSRLVVLSITGTDLGGSDGSTTIFCDVLVGGGVFNDNAVADLSAELINPEPDSGTYYEAIEVDQINVEYSRSDGKNEPGVDIPYPFTQYLNYTIPIGSSVEIPFVIVRHVAKLEAPLIDLRDLGQEKILQLTAKVTIFAKDKAGNRIPSVEGTVTLWCANFGD